jgi:ABC-type transport system involved in multi-copper enzyme maturation permease subunit
MRDTERPVPFPRAARAVFDISLDGMLWGRRALVLVGLLALPVAFALLYRGVLLTRLPPQIAPLDLYRGLVAFFYVRNVLPLLALFLASALVADEVEGRTLTYLLTRPDTRASILAGKFGAYLAASLSLSLPPVVVTFLLLATTAGRVGIGPAVPGLFRDLGVMALALLVYGAVFALLGVLTRRPLLLGLLFLYVWETLAVLPGYVPRLTITVWLRSLLGHAPAARGFQTVGEALPVGLSLAVLVGVGALALGLALALFQRREYVLEQ